MSYESFNFLKFTQKINKWKPNNARTTKKYVMTAYVYLWTEHACVSSFPNMNAIHLPVSLFTKI